MINHPPTQHCEGALATGQKRKLRPTYHRTLSAQHWIRHPRRPANRPAKNRRGAALGEPGRRRLKRSDAVAGSTATTSAKPRVAVPAVSMKDVAT
jgi:hypothetical protein